MAQEIVVARLRSRDSEGSAESWIQSLRRRFGFGISLCSVSSSRGALRCALVHSDSKGYVDLIGPKGKLSASSISRSSSHCLKKTLRKMVWETH